MTFAVLPYDSAGDGGGATNEVETVITPDDVWMADGFMSDVDQSTRSTSDGTTVRGTDIAGGRERRSGWILGYHECSSRKARPREVTPPLRSLRGGDVGDGWALDVADPLPTSYGDERYVIAAGKTYLQSNLVRF